MSEIAGTAYIQIEPRADGISGKIASAMGSEAESAGKSAGSSFSSGFGSVLSKAGAIAASAVAAGGAAVGALVTQAVSSYGEYEQLVGGVETLFGDAADTVIKNSSNAFQTAGMSANDYMETVTSFSASLLQSLDGDTEKAAAAADTAIQDMSDNANKMGSDMSSIQNAYQGFAKQNYTMLDNLKLGYGGTKTEMERLLADASELSGVEYNIDSLSDVYEAIHVVQTEMGITGTTAKEASTTIQGSLASMKSAWENVVTAMGTEGGDLDGTISTLITTAETFAGNLMPVIETALTGVSGLISQLAPVIATEIPNLITQCLPSLLNAGVQIISALGEGLLTALPALMPTVMDVVMQLVQMLIDNAPMLLETGMQLLLQLAQGLTDALPTLVPAVVQVITEMTLYLLEHIDLLINAGVQLITALGQGLINAVPQLVASLPQICTALINAINTWQTTMLDCGWKLLLKLGEGIQKAKETIKAKAVEIINNMINAIKAKITEFIAIGKNIVDGIKQGITEAWTGITSWISDKVTGLKDTVKNVLKIGSPSKVFADEVGRWIPAGIAKGIDDNMGVLDDTISGMTTGLVASASLDADAVTSQMYVQASAKNDADAEIYALLSTYLPQLAQNGSVTVNLEGDAERLFKMTQMQATKYKRTTGNPAFT